ncbi:MAG: CheB methylesterase domain-containing protein, partial [Thermoplasmata archaeon]
ASTGGPKAIEYIITRLPATLPAGVIIVQHMPEGFTKSFAERLNTLSQLEVKEAEEGDEIQTGRVIIAPGNRHLRIIGGRIILSDGEKINNVRPAADPMMESGANEYGSNTMGIILTGMGVDGARGMAAIKKHGGKTIAQDRESSVVFGMPRAAIELGAVDVVVPLVDIPRTILRTLETMI